MVRVRFGPNQWILHPQDSAVLDSYEAKLRLVKKHGMRVMLSLFHHSFPPWGMNFGGRESNDGAAAGEMFQHVLSACWKWLQISI